MLQATAGGAWVFSQWEPKFGSVLTPTSIRSSAHLCRVELCSGLLVSGTALARRHFAASRVKPHIPIVQSFPVPAYALQFKLHREPPPERQSGNHPTIVLWGLYSKLPLGLQITFRQLGCNLLAPIQGFALKIGSRVPRSRKSLARVQDLHRLTGWLIHTPWQHLET